MKSENLARAMTEIDDELIAEARTKPVARLIHWKRWSAAACLVLVLTAVLLAGTGRVRLSVDGTALSAQSVSIPMAAPAPARLAPYSEAAPSAGNEIVILLETGSSAQIAVSGGTVRAAEAATGEPLAEGGTVQAKGSLLVSWILPDAGAADGLKMTVSTWLESSTLVLVPDYERQCYLITVD